MCATLINCLFSVKLSCTYK